MTLLDLFKTLDEDVQVILIDNDTKVIYGWGTFDDMRVDWLMNWVKYINVHGEGILTVVTM